MLKLLTVPLLAAALLSSPAAHACACGCGLFDVGDGSDMGNKATLWLRFSSLDQSDNHAGASNAPASDNKDQRINTQFYTLGADIRLNRNVSLTLEQPLYDRRFTTTDDGTYAASVGNMNTRHITALGDGMVKLSYLGALKSKALVLTLGVKLPNGQYHAPLGPLGGTAFDRDTMPGTGSTDVLLGAGYYAQSGEKLHLYAQGEYHAAVASVQDYRPGNEANMVLGMNYQLNKRFAPVLQLVGQARAHDSGENADSANSGGQRLFIATGARYWLNPRLSLYGDVELPLYQYSYAAVAGGDSRGQLVAPLAMKMQLNMAF
jgi:predicted porin